MPARSDQAAVEDWLTSPPEPLVVEEGQAAPPQALGGPAQSLEPPDAGLRPEVEEPVEVELQPTVEHLVELGPPPLREAEHPMELEQPPLPGPPAQRRLRGSAPRAGGGRLTRARVGALAALVVAALVVWLLVSIFQPFVGAAHGSVIVDIPKGSSSSAIGSVLARDGVVSSGFFFELRALLEGKRGDLHSGRFRMQRGMSYAAAIAALSKPPPARITVRVVIPEGETAAQIAQIAAAEDLTGSYLAAARRSRLLDPARYGAPHGTPDLEGFLFPATYELSAGTPASRLVAEQLTAFQQNFGPVEIHRARVLHVTPYQLLTIASMVEREALLAHDRPLVAAVIYNRLHQGIALGIDATIRYALNDYTHPLTEAQLRLDSPYNTRTHHGLPPTPISNPGMASIEAAAHPAHVPYLYYVNGADGCGELVFSTSYAKFERNAAAYQAALSHNGGRVPPCRKR